MLDGTEVSWDFYDIHDRHKERDLNGLRKYREREDVEQYTGKESLTRTMGEFLEATGGRMRNSNVTAWEKEISSCMICTNNPAEGPFATARAFLHMYPTLKLRTLATLCAAVVNGTYKPAHTGKVVLLFPLTLNLPFPMAPLPNPFRNPTRKVKRKIMLLVLV